ncbi:MAG TPA: LssY C-terminal domain-containing protein [Bryobacteraceae bacterium]|nr:LssY C-terminal domain-containing protein [Bryobacteraceae bacterium]
MKLIALSVLAAFALWCQIADKPVDIDIPADKVWTDTGIDVAPGESVAIEASGNITYQGKDTGPEGLARGWADLIKVYPLNDAKRGALIGRIGNNEAARPFLIGTRTDRQIPISGRLFLGINQGSMDRASGSYRIRLTRTKGAVAVRSNEDLMKGLAKITQTQLDEIPNRVVDADGLAGDRVNFFIIGSEIHVVSALEKAGWVKVDRSVKDTIFRGILASMSKQAYVTLPMSELTMFGRPQDYGMAHADPIKVVAARHHFRIWRAPFTAGGRTVWIGAGTHDIGFDRDQRNGKITHKIDPDTDGEREFIGQSLQETGEVLLLDYMTHKDPVKEAKTAHGEAYHSDGRTLMIYLKPDESDSSKAFTDVFCTVLAKNNPDGGQWDGCDSYVEGGGSTTAALPDLSKDYRVLIVPGFMSSCFADSPAFNEGLPVLREKYGMNVEYLQVPNDGSETNAKVIADFLKEKSVGDTRKWILVGYSKGTPDIQEALARYPELRPGTAAFISVAGASGGSNIADVIPSMVDKYMNQYKLKPTCKGDMAVGFKSLSKMVRGQFLANYPNPFVPTYSIIAASDKNNTSKALLQTWQLLFTYDPLQDGQLTRGDAIIPGSAYLGVAKGDHFAVALPFDKSTDPTTKIGMDKTRYPRGALIESLLRYVTDDLAKKKR